ncbi:hypothetical protein SDC9_180922 [bioreactor metagenome]|uniref:N-acetyltransferase domain-containing protein n=1 Tax=bioreactor metagenome TaxID=1076179 RepID=A0A645H325_9ZZZZ
MTIKKIQVVPAEEKYIDDIYAITQEAFSKYAFDLGRPDLVMALKETADDIRRDIAHKHVFVALLDSQPVGSIRYELKHGIGYISRFGVKLTAQSCGIGHALIQAVVDDCRANNIPAIALHTSSKMSSLIRFYYGHGFYIRTTSTDRGYVRALLIKELQPDFEPDIEALKP